jgi:hypothetical protein
MNQYKIEDFTTTGTQSKYQKSGEFGKYLKTKNPELYSHLTQSKRSYFDDNDPRIYLDKMRDKLVDDKVSDWIIKNHDRSTDKAFTKYALRTIGRKLNGVYSIV